MEIDALENEVIELQRKGGELKAYSYYLASLGKYRTTLFIFGVVVFGVSNKLNQLLLTYWTDAVMSSGNQVNGFYLAMFGLLCAVTIISLNGTAWLVNTELVTKCFKLM